MIRVGDIRGWTFIGLLILCTVLHTSASNWQNSDNRSPRQRYHGRGGKGLEVRDGNGMNGGSDRPQCLDEVLVFEFLLFLDLVGTPDDITLQELRILEQGFIDTYNGLTTASCGPDSLVIESIEVDLVINPGLVDLRDARRLQNGKNNGGNGGGRRRFMFRGTGRCRGCRRGKKVFNDDSSRRRKLNAITAKAGNHVLRRTGRRYRNQPSSPLWKWLNQHSYQKKRGKGKGKGRKRRKRRGKGKGRKKRVKRKRGKGSEPAEENQDPVLCDCPSPLLSDFLNAFNALIRSNDQLVNVDAVVLIRELEEVDCGAPISPFDDEVFIEHTGEPTRVTQSEIVSLEQAFVETYNRINAQSIELCDPIFRVIDSVESFPDSPVNVRRLQGGRRSFIRRYIPSGRCRGCNRKTRIHDDANDRRRELALSSIQLNNRTLQQETCYCPPGGLSRAPTEEEFIVAFNESIQELRQEGLTNVDTAELNQVNPPPPETEDVVEVVPPGGTVVNTGSATASCETDDPGTLTDVDLCILTDLSQSYEDDLRLLRVATEEIYAALANVATTRLGVAGYVDYVDNAFPYMLFSALSPDAGISFNAINALSVTGGGDPAESQYDAIVGAVQGLVYTDSSGQTTRLPDCGWSQDPNVVRLLVVTTDAVNFHVPADNPRLYQNDFDSTVQALNNANNVRVIGLTSPRTGTELDSLATATGGTTVPLSSGGSNIAFEIINTVQKLQCKIVPNAVGCGDLVVSFDPTSADVDPGAVATFQEIYSVPQSTASGTVFDCIVEFSSDGVVVESHGVQITVP